MKAGWNNLQLAWTLPDIYRICVSEYVVQVCGPSDCLDAVTVHSMFYSVSNLSVCTLYSGSVVVKLPDTRLSTRNATVSLLTKSADPYKLQSFHVVKVTTNTVEYQWKVWKMPPACAREFVLSTFSTNGSIIANKELDYSHRKYTVLDLKPCQSYSFELKLVDEHGSSTIDYNTVNVVTEASDLMSVSNLELDRVSLYSLYLKWFLPEESSACVSNYMVTFLTTDNNTMGTITPNKYTTWTGGTCRLDSVSVQIISKGQLRGVPAKIDIRRIYEDVKFLTFKVNKVATLVLLTSESFVCVTNYKVIWYTPGSGVITSPFTKFNHSVSTGHLLPCTKYTAVVQPWNDRFILQNITYTLETAYEGGHGRGASLKLNVVENLLTKCLMYALPTGLSE
ncbi:hypothetical protein J6590_031608 [Homalodisca vitripennis]|nr:hypothetical protein J6590_031608 [Homalodisca vitripennis]